ncbi:hypothetical protein ANO11243_041380 [Dothideomycetidae sp. 11243]|nr:hypothetical protein ANO11243_041380 [fungal sp. No.11243]
MRFSSSLLTAICAAAAVQAAVPMKSVLVSYPKEALDSVVDTAMQAITDAGGEITHVYDIFKGFAAIAPAQILEAQVMNVGGATIEEDKEYTVQSQPGVN